MKGRVLACGTAARAGRCPAALTRDFEMPNSRYFILETADGWAIRFADADFGPYRTRQEALMFAVDAAQQLGEVRGENAEVCLLGDNGHFRPEWTFGRDRYPPRL